MTVQEDLSPKVTVSGPLAVNDVIPLDFGYINKEDIKVDNNGSLLAYNIDYEVIGQSVKILVDIDGVGPITAYRDTPLNQEAEFPQNNKFNSAKLNESLDKICMQQQEQEERIGRSIILPIGLPATFDSTIPTPVPGRAIKIKSDGTGFEYTAYDPDHIEEAVDEAIEQAELAKDWAVKMTDPVYDPDHPEESDYSSKYYANEAREQAEQAGIYADQAEFGTVWVPFIESNWNINDSDHYEIELSDITPEGLNGTPLALAVYSGTFENKKLVCGVNITTTPSDTILESLNRFDGFILCSSNFLGRYEHVQTLESNTWVIEHYLGFIPCVTLLDTNNVVMVGTIQHQSVNKCTVTFTNAVAGKAYLR